MNVHLNIDPWEHRHWEYRALVTYSSDNTYNGNIEPLKHRYCGCRALGPEALRMLREHSAYGTQALGM